MEEKIPIRVKPSERKRLEKIRRKGTESARVIRRAQVLLQLHKGWTRERICDATGVSTATIGRVRRRYLKEGLESALYERSRPGRPRNLVCREERELIALACSKPPDGAARWTVRLLAKSFGNGKRVSKATVQRILTEDGLKPWREKNVVRSRTK